MHIGYLRVSKSDGSQTTDLQRDALIGAGVDPSYIYEEYRKVFKIGMEILIFKQP
jgi:DNA invertase Pin-like site-specific DNA recombinase